MRRHGQGILQAGLCRPILPPGGQRSAAQQLGLGTQLLVERSTQTSDRLIGGVGCPLGASIATTGFPQLQQRPSHQVASPLLFRQLTRRLEGFRPLDGTSKSKQR